MMTTGWSPLGSPGRWTGSAAGTPHGRCRPPSAITQARERLGSSTFPELIERTGGPVAGPVGPRANLMALGTARGAFLRGWRLVAIDGCEVDMPDSPDNATEFGYAGSGDNRSAFPKATVVAVAECATGTHTRLNNSAMTPLPSRVLACEIAYGVGTFQSSRQNRRPRGPFVNFRTTSS
jgi:hypothetical protein